MGFSGLVEFSGIVSDTGGDRRVAGSAEIDVRIWYAEARRCGSIFVYRDGWCA